MLKSKERVAHAAGTALFLLLAISVFSLDQAVKRKINREKAESFPRRVKGTRGILEVRKAENPGFTMGKGEKYPRLVRLASVLATLFLLFSLPYLSYTTGGAFLLQNFGASLVVGGAMSNTFDRVYRGKVTDYLYIRLGFLKKMIINIGDIALFFGAAFYFAGILPNLMDTKKAE